MIRLWFRLRFVFIHHLQYVGNHSTMFQMSMYCTAVKQHRVWGGGVNALLDETVVVVVLNSNGARGSVLYSGAQMSFFSTAHAVFLSFFGTDGSHLLFDFFGALYKCTLL